MDNLEYSTNGAFPLPGEDDLAKLKTDSLRPIVSTFVANVLRLHSVWRLLPHLVELSCTNTARLTEAIFALTGKPLLSEEESKDQELMKRINKQVWDDIEIRAKEMGISKVKAAGYDFSRGVNRFDELLLAIPSMNEEVAAALATQLLGAFTAFEVLAADLWVTALNDGPKKLVSHWTDKQEKAQDKAIPLWAIHEASYDLSKLMGTILRNTGRVSFVSLATTQRAYEKAFGNELPPILEDENLRILEFARNLISHRAGKIDETFRRQMAPLKHPFGQLVAGETLKIDGRIVRELCKTVVEKGQELSRFVDSCLVMNLAM